MRKYIAAAVVCALVLLGAYVLVSVPGSLPVEVPPGDANLRYVGRFEISAENGATCAWPASAITIRFRGTAINARLDLGDNRFEVVVDGKPVRVLSPGWFGGDLYSLASGLPDADHVVTLFKRTEAEVGTARFMGFQLNQGATLLPAPVAERRIEVIGDSISAGYGNEGTANEHFSPRTENAYLTYGAITARAFNAEYVCIAWKGKRLWPLNTLPEIYDQVLPGTDGTVWNFNAWKPDAVLINLGTNDFFAGVPEEEGWVKAYHDFIDHVRKNYPDAVIYVALGPMLNNQFPPGEMALATAFDYLRRVVQECNSAGDAKVRFLQFDTQYGASTFGADRHPNVLTHQAMAQKFIAALQADLGWQPLEAAP
jgi:lysophospholipase L1-like esterase